MSKPTILCVDSSNNLFYNKLSVWTQASGKFQNINFSNNQYYGVDINADIGYNLNYTSSNLNTRRILGGNSNTAQQKIKSISFDGYTNNLVCLMDNGRILNSSIVPPTKSEVINWPTISAFLTYDIAKYVAISNNQMCVIYTNKGLQCMSDYKVFDPVPITLPDGVTTIKQVAFDGYRQNILILTDTGIMYYGEYRGDVTNDIGGWAPFANLNNVTNIALSNNEIVCTTAEGKVYYGSIDPLTTAFVSPTLENIPVSFTPLSISVDGYTSDPIATSAVSNYSLRKTAAAAATAAAREISRAAAAAKAAADAAAKATADAAAAKAAADAAVAAAATSTDPTARATADAAVRAAAAAAATAATANAEAATASTSAAASNPTSNSASNPTSNSVSNPASQTSATSTETPNTDNTMMIIIIIVIILVIIGIIFIYMKSSNNKNKYSDIVVKKGGYYYFT